MTENQTETVRIYVGTYTRREPHVDGKSTGIHILRFDTSTGKLAHESTISGIENPSYLALHPKGTALYAISEVSEFDGRPVGAVYAYSIDPVTHETSLLSQRSVKGSGPAYITIDSTGSNVLVANYGSGSVSVLPIQPDLSLGGCVDFVQHEGSSINPQRQEAPHAHSIVLDGSDRFALAADLGLDKIMIYRYEADTGMLSPNPDQAWARAKSGAGPRHIAFHPSQEFVYVINELDSTIVTYRYDAVKGAMSEVQTISTLPEGFEDRNYTADIHVHPTGKFVYGSNRGHDSIAIYTVNEETGELTDVRFVSSGGNCPRGFAVEPTGGYVLVANQDSDNIVVFSIDPGTGDLTPTGEIAEVPTPVCIKMLA